jgi:hypothetical protein
MNSMVVGSLGGTVALEQVTMVIPPNALTQDTNIVMVSTTDTDPGYVNRSPIYQFGPDGTTFDQPVSVTIGYSDDGQPVSLFWSNAAGGYDEIQATVANGTLTGYVSHFSHGFVGRHRQTSSPDAAPDAAPNPVDAAPDGPTQCMVNGTGCTVDTAANCCTHNCVNAICAAPLNCAQAGIQCNPANNFCCSGICSNNFCQP